MAQACKIRWQRYARIVPYQSVEERMDRLEVLVTTFVQHTDEAITELRQGSADLRQDIAEMRQWRLQAQKQWGEIANKLGSFVEDIVAPNIPAVAQQILGAAAGREKLLAAARSRVSHPQDNSRQREFDHIYATQEGWILVESKNDPKLKDVDGFRELLAEASEYFPQYASLPLRPIFAALNVPDHVVNYCTRHRIYAMGLGPETMQLLNAAALAANPG